MTQQVESSHDTLWESRRTLAAQARSLAVLYLSVGCKCPFCANLTSVFDVLKRRTGFMGLDVASGSTICACREDTFTADRQAEAETARLASKCGSGREEQE